MANFKYVNANPFPIYLPCERGGQVVFRTGESSTKQWFSQFCGRQQLTKVPIAELPVAPPPAPKTPVVLDKGVVIENIGALAEALVQALGGKTLGQLSTPSAAPVALPAFDSTRSMEAMADTMSKQTGEKKGNIDKIGTTKVTKKPAGQAEKTVGLLADLD